MSDANMRYVGGAKRRAEGMLFCCCVAFAVAETPSSNLTYGGVALAVHEGCKGRERGKGC